MHTTTNDSLPLVSPNPVSDLGSEASLTVPRPHLVKQDSDNFLSYYGSEDAGRTYTQSPSQHEPLKSPVKEMSSDSVSSSDYSLDSPIPTSIMDKSKTTLPKKDLLEGSRRSGVRSEGGMDRRRLAIVQMDSSNEDLRQPADSGRGYATDVPSDNLRSRRGFGSRLGDLALVAPPDASPRTYRNLTPPSTAPPSGDRTMQSASAVHSPFSTHHRSHSDAINPIKPTTHHQHNSSRDIGIVGTGHAAPANDRSKEMEQTSLRVNPESLTAPIFQLPQLHSASSGTASNNAADSPLPTHSSEYDFTPLKLTGKQPILTPDIGQEKDASVSVAPPIIVSLAPVKIQSIVSKNNDSPVDPQAQQTPFTPISPPFLNYQPGIHATAGPLPPPPRAIFTVTPNSPPPPRPPRLSSPPPTRRRGVMEPVTQSLQLPVDASLPKRPQSATSSLDENFAKFYQDEASDQIKIEIRNNSHESLPSSQRRTTTPVHRREGAFPPSVLIPADTPIVNTETKSTRSDDAVSCPTNSAVDSVENPSSISVSTTIESQPVEENNRGAAPGPGPEVRQNRSWINDPLSRGSTPASEHSRQAAAHVSPPTPPRSPAPKRHTLNTPSPPPKSPKGIKAGLVNLKRFSSLPRPPSLVSKGSSNGPRTPSPPSITVPPLPIQKIKSPWPSAMQCSDILSKRSPLDRCAGYAQKINELYICDCGLGDWLADVKYKGIGSKRTTTRNTAEPGALANAMGGQPRQTSRSSGISEVTFPRRLDSSVATDLSVMPKDDISAPIALPPLPYPSLAQSQRRPTRSSTATVLQASTRSLVSPTVGKSGGFFSSLGRKASVKKDKSSGSGLSSHPSSLSGKLLVKNPPTNSVPRPVNIDTTPSVPGGPRAAPNRAKRSQTIMISSRFSSNDRSATLARRPSLNELSSDAVINVQPDPEFTRQVDKLADLLPRANRNILAGYLRRAGQDILAIGQYLEDEKNGTIRLE